jgi:hypothetical protein
MQATDTDIREIRDLILAMDKKMDIFIVKTDERFNSIDERFKFIDTQLSDIKKSTEIQLSDIKKSTEIQFSDIKTQLRSQDNRLWGFIAVLSVAVIGFLGKLAFFPDLKV